MNHWKETGRIVYELDDKNWYMKQMNPNQGVSEGIHLLPAERDLCFTGWNEATVPGDVYSDLQRAGVIDDPYYGRNLVRLSWVQYCEWWYICRFNAPSDCKNLDVQLLLEGVVYSCEVWLNGNHLGKHEGMFSPIAFDVSRYLNSDISLDNSSECDNYLAIKIDPAPQSLYNIAGKHHTFSGDYLPGFVPVGIWRSVKLIATNNVRIEGTRIESSINPEQTEALVSVDSEVEILKGGTFSYDVRTVLRNPQGKEYSKEEKVLLSSGTNEIATQISVAEPEIWWPWDMGDQPLYHATVEISLNGTIVDTKTTRFGIREIIMERNPTITEEEAEFPWTFVINGKATFLRSGCWGGPPSLLYGRNTPKKYRHFLQLAKECNLNNLRIFGWHPPEIPDFYDICDEIGITVWTNFPLASQVLRDDPEYVNSVLYESAEIVKERRNHPSNIFWMGGEEVFFSEAQVNSHNKRMMKQVGRHIANYTNVPYADASMMSSAPAIKLGYKPKECIHANLAYYAAGTRFIEDYFPQVDACIIPELAAASAPSVESLQRFVPPEDLWPMGLTWGYLMANINILKAVNFEIFGDIRCDSLEQFAESTQISQGETFKYALELFRRRKPRVSGVAICHFITNRPLMKWEIVDYYGKPKKSYEYVQKAFQPLLVTLDYPKRRYMPDENFQAKVFVVNDYYKEYKNLQCTVKFFDDKEHLLKTITETIDVSENSAIEYFQFSATVAGDLGEFFKVELILTENDVVVSKNDYNFLLADQEESRVKAKELYQVHREQTLKYGKTLYRDFHELCDLD